MLKAYSQNMLIAKIPSTPAEWEKYYDLRFVVLREPWHQKKGSEVLADENEADHVMAIDSETDELLGVARLQMNSATQGQVRCVAVSKNAQGKGVGKFLMKYLEDLGKSKGLEEIILDARINALDFYKAIGYEIYADSYLLFGEIQHWKMKKQL